MDKLPDSVLLEFDGELDHFAVVARVRRGPDGSGPFFMVWVPKVTLDDLQRQGRSK